jgi:hypothetical protein
MLAALTSGDWTAVATVGGFLVIIGGVVERFATKRLRSRRTRKLGVRKTEAAVWGSKATEFDPEQPGLIKIVADLAKQVEKQGRDQDVRMGKAELRIAKLEEESA